MHAEHFARMVLRVLALVLALTGAPARAQDGEAESRARDTLDSSLPPLRWDPQWGHASSLDGVVMGGSLAGLVAFQIVSPPRRWTRAGGFDRGVRDRLRFDRDLARDRAGDVSDLTLAAGIAIPTLFDGLVGALAVRRSAEVARQLAWLALEVQLVTGAVQSAANVLAGRERPFARDCGGALDEDDPRCRDDARWRSFFSGHTALAFAAAANTCMVHARLRFHDGPRNASSCVAATGLAVATAYLRIAGDFHWSTDVLTGALVGTSIGTLLPMLRMRTWGAGHSQDVAAVRVVPFGIGLALLGVMP